MRIKKKYNAISIGLDKPKYIKMHSQAIQLEVSTGSSLARGLYMARPAGPVQAGKWKLIFPASRIGKWKAIFPTGWAGTWEAILRRAGPGRQKRNEFSNCLAGQQIKEGE